MATSFTCCDLFDFDGFRPRLTGVSPLARQQSIACGDFLNRIGFSSKPIDTAYVLYELMQLAPFGRQANK